MLIKMKDIFKHWLDQRVKAQKSINMLEIKKNEIAQPILDKIAELKQELLDKTKSIQEQIDVIDEEISSTDGKLRESWYHNDKKQYLGGFKVERRDLKRLEVNNKEVLTQELSKLGKLPEAIKSFDEKLVKDIAGLNLLSPEACEVKIFPSISCKFEGDE